MPKRKSSHRPSITPFPLFPTPPFTHFFFLSSSFDVYGNRTSGAAGRGARGTMTGEDFQRTVPRRHKRFLWQFQHFSRDCIAKEGICIEGMWSGSLILFFPLFFAPFFKCVYIVFLFSFWCRNDNNKNWFLMMIIFNVTSSGNNNDNDEGNYSNNNMQQMQGRHV